MKKYAVFITLVALGLLIYILAGGVPSGSAPGQVTTRAGAAWATSAPAVRIQTSVPTEKPSVRTYVLNKNTKVFHYPSCSSVDQMKDSNKRTFTGTRQEVIAMGYKPCGRCHP